MAKAIFSKVFNFNDVKRGTSWRIKPSDEPQSFPERVIAAAVAKGAAKPVSADTKAPAAAGKSEG